MYIKVQFILGEKSIIFSRGFFLAYVLLYPTVNKARSISKQETTKESSVLEDSLHTFIHFTYLAFYAVTFIHSFIHLSLHL